MAEYGYFLASEEFGPHELVGVGTGESLNEHILGGHWPSAHVRAEMLEEAVGIGDGYLTMGPDEELLAQRDEPRVPVLQSIDARLTDGRRFAGLPEDAAAWRASLADRAAIHLTEGARAVRRVPETPVSR